MTRFFQPVAVLGALLGVGAAFFLVTSPEEATAARNSAGTYSLPAGNPVVSGTPISTTWANNTLNDVSTEITNSLDRGGRGAMTAALQGFAGTVSAPGFTFSTDTDTGIYRIGANNLGVTAGGSKILDVGTGGLSLSAVTSLPDGEEESPSLAFTSDADTGVYWVSDGNFALTANGTRALQVSPTTTTATGNIALAGSDPASTAGFSDTITPLSFAKAFATINISNAATFVPSVLSGLNIASVARTDAATVRVTFATAMANANYAVAGSIASTLFLNPVPYARTTTYVDIRATNGGSFYTLDGLAAPITLMILVFGAQ